MTEEGEWPENLPIQRVESIVPSEKEVKIQPPSKRPSEKMPQEENTLSSDHEEEPKIENPFQNPEIAKKTNPPSKRDIHKAPSKK